MLLWKLAENALKSKSIDSLHEVTVGQGRLSRVIVSRPMSYSVYRNDIQKEEKIITDKSSKCAKM